MWFNFKVLHGSSVMEMQVATWLPRISATSYLSPDSLPYGGLLCHHHLFPSPWPPLLCRLCLIVYEIFGVHVRDGAPESTAIEWQSASCSRRDPAQFSIYSCLTIYQMGLGRAHSPSGLSVRDWASDLVLVQGTE